MRCSILNLAIHKAGFLGNSVVSPADSTEGLNTYKTYAGGPSIFSSGSCRKSLGLVSERS